MDNKAIIIGIVLIAIGSFFLGVNTFPQTIHTTTTVYKQTTITATSMTPEYIEIPDKSWVTIGDHYFSYAWVGSWMSKHEVHYCGTGMTWDGFSVGIGTTIYVADWGTYKITDMNEAYVCLTLQK